MFTDIELLQLKNAVSRILHVPGNYMGGVLEMAIAVDYNLSEDILREECRQIADMLKKQNETFRNVRLNLIRWISDEQIEKEVIPLSFLLAGRAFARGADVKKTETDVRDLKKETKALDELFRQLKLFYARSKVILVLTDGSYRIKDKKAVKEYLQPFLARKLLLLQNGEQLQGIRLFMGIKMDKEIRAVVFDMDGVLFDTEKLFLDTYKEVAAERGMKLVEKTVMGCIGLNIKDTEALFKQEYGEDFLFAEYHAVCTARARRRIEEQGLPMKQGVCELLAYLKEEGYRIALASSTGRHGVLGHLDRAGITGFFEVIIGGDMVAHGKPEPDIYLRACAELGVNPADTLAIEDSPNGIRSAHAAGLKPIMVPDLIAPTPEIERLLYAKCESLKDVKKMLMNQK